MTPGPLTRRVRAVLRMLLPPEYREPLLNDLDEEFGGRPWAYAGEALRTMPFAIGLRMRRWRLGRIGSDLRLGARSLRRAPWYFATVAGVIAVSTAFGVTAFAIVDGALFRPLSYRDADRVFTVSPGFTRLPDRTDLTSASVAEFDAWQAAIPSATFGAAYTVDAVTFGKEEADHAYAARISAGYLDALGVAPLIGGFTADDYAAPYAPIQPALISYGLWQRRFGASPGVLGQTFVEGVRGIRIVGILPQRFAMPETRPIDVLTPLNFSARQPFSRGTDNKIIVRLPAGMTADDAGARMLAGAEHLAAEWPPPPSGPRVSETTRIAAGPADVVRVEPIRSGLTSRTGQSSRVLFASALVLVLLACLNVAALATARVQDRWRDLSVRRAIGAGSADLMRMLTAEHAIVVLVGTAAGLVAARPVLRTTLDLMPPWVLLRDAAIDVRAVAFAGLLAAACLALIAVVSCRAALGERLRFALSDGGTTTRRGKPWMVSGLVGVATVVTVGSMLVVASLVRVWREDPGFRTDAGVLWTSSPTGATPAQLENLMTEFSELPGVISAGATNEALLQRSISGSDFDAPTGRPSPEFASYAVTHGYLDAAGLKLVAGRLPTAAEFASGAPVLVVSAKVAQALWPDTTAVGQTLTSNGRDFAVIGVITDARYMIWDSEPQGQLYYPLTSLPTARISTILVNVQPGIALPEVAKAFRTVCQECRLVSARWIWQLLNQTIQSRRFYGWLFGGFGVVALLITATGVLGLVAITTARRTREIGVRMALGATRPTVVRHIVREQAAAMLMGLAGGGVVAALAVRVVSLYLYKTDLYDPYSWLAAIGALITVAMVSAALPSIRASRVDLVQTLKPE